MAKQTKSKSKAKNPEKIGKGKVTPVQVAFIVDRYLSDNNFTQTRSAFRTEAPDLVSRSPVQEVPKSLLTLGELLDEYIVLKEKKVILDQEKARLEQEKFRVQNLVQGMQMVLNAYNAGGAAAALPPTASPGIAQSSAVVSQIDLTSGSPAGYPVHNTPAIMSTFRLSSTSNLRSFSTPMTNPTTSKRRNSSIDALDAPKTAKRSRNSTINQLKAKGIETPPQPSNAPSNNRAALDVSAVQASPQVDEHNGSPFQGYSVAKCLFNQNSQSPPNNSFPKTPPRPTSSQTGISVSPMETATSTDNVTPHQITSTNCTVITSEMIRVSPEKQIAYYSIERNHRISSSSPIKTNLKRLSKRDHVKGRLDFDGSDTAMNSGILNSCGISASEPPKAGDIFDMDLPSLDALGLDFSLSDLLLDFDLDGEGTDYSCQHATDHSSPESLTGSPHTLGTVDMGSNQVLSELSSSVTEILSEKDMNTPGPESVTSVKCMTKCIRALSPVKSHKSASDQENLSGRS